ncbi:uncharacterized protein THITE_2113324 [Thermothielavioides terrestris NRRL 8126]|uniref:Myb-like domain-containing protein n=1 Tax=Thermothielavioides terrestris (strain ATCC 38088 / NRRL 8126) TaxID=578455 RepID=G2R2F5_THETT|nr:uncharacterized protein THITE_2113324 [Thermothielavioides terrestris NRRL 8126]AEO65828.1 hypothetical protein THITE_2113324 [Thermothielavioides terrestris NRRL 8126]
MPCDSSRTRPLTRLQSALFASPPASPPQPSTQTAIGNIFSTCRTLQSLLASPTSPSIAGADPTTPPKSSPAQLPSPPLAHAKLRLRTRKPDPAAGDHGPARKRIVKRTAAVAQPPRGPNKRRRADDDDDDPTERYSENDSDAEQHEPLHNPIDGRNKENELLSNPRTPKRSRIAPEVLPLGLERSDFHSLHSSSVLSNDSSADGPSDYSKEGTDVVVEADGETWSTEEDRILVELVLEKLKLTKTDWQDCARSLGKNRGSVGRRWRSLMINGEVGLRRTRIHGTWR